MAVREQAQLKRRRPEAGTDRRHAHVNRCVLEAWLAGREPGDLAIAQRRRRTEPHHVHRWAAVERRQRMRPGICAVREKHDARDVLPAELLAYGVQARGEVAGASVRLEAI